MSKRWPEKVIIGLTGNIATGKSAVMRMAAEQGALTLDADKIVHEILATDKAVQAAIVRQFGPSVAGPDGQINRAAMAAVVFRDELALSALEQILHPVVRTVIVERVTNNEANLVMIEAIKLLEGSLAAECDQIWVTRCPKVKQIERLMVCRGMDSETAALRVNAQSSQEEKVAMADVVIDTDGTMADTRQLFEMAWERVVQLLSGPIRPAAVIEGEAPPAEIGVETVVEDVPAVEAATVAEQVAEAPVAPAEPAPTAAAEEQPKSPPERLSGSKAAEIRKRMLARKETEETDSPAAQPEPEKIASDLPQRADGVVVRRARPPDVPSILLLIQRATDGAVKIKRSELLLALGDRGYLIGQQGSEISTVIGWHSENLIARIDQIYVYPPESAEVAGPAVLQEIEDTAVNLMCEVILAFPPNGIAPPVLKLLLDRHFEEVEPARLPDVWQVAVAESKPDDTFILMKKLRDTRVMKPV